MKRVWCVLLTALLVLSCMLCAGCGQNTESQQEQKEPQDVQTEQPDASGDAQQEEQQPEVEQQPDEQPDLPETTTETFTFDLLKLTVEVSNVVLTRKGTVIEDENSNFENDVFVVLPGAVVTVKEAATFADPDDVEHGEWKLYSTTQGTLELLAGAELAIEPGDCIGKESFPVLAFQVYEG